MTDVDIRGLHEHGLLVTDTQGVVAVVNGKGWTSVPAPLSQLVLKALSADDDDDAA